MRKFIVSPNPSSNFSNTSFLANKKAPDHSGLEPGQTLIAALGGSAQVCSVICFPRTPLCGPPLSSIFKPNHFPFSNPQPLALLLWIWRMEEPVRQSCTLNGSREEGRGKQEKEARRTAEGYEQRKGKSPKEDLSPVSSSLPEEPGILGWVTLRSQLNASLNRNGHMFLGGFKSSLCINPAVCPGQGTHSSDDVSTSLQ